jgi:Uma2 family endonuclease
MPPEGPPHASDSSRTGEFLIYLLGQRAHIRFAKPITLPNNSEPEPDLAIVQRLDDYYRNHHPYAENIFWLIEYANSSLERDLGVKADLYATANIPEYWVINLQENKLIVFRDPVNGKYQSRQELTSGSISPLAFADVTIDIAQLLR